MVHHGVARWPDLGDESVAGRLGGADGHSRQVHLHRPGGGEVLGAPLPNMLLAYVMLGTGLAPPHPAYWPELAIGHSLYSIVWAPWCSRDHTGSYLAYCQWRTAYSPVVLGHISCTLCTVGVRATLGPVQVPVLFKT